MHDDPAHPWTVASLAAQVGASRSSLARDSARHVGEPPMTQLATWRVALAADLLRDTDDTVGSVAHEVGYSDTVRPQRRLQAPPRRHPHATPGGGRACHGPDRLTQRHARAAAPTGGHHGPETCRDLPRHPRRAAPRLGA
ncbi:helix-turn-helix transcriptional regulator [Streptomyces sp. NPDC051742]|uniref:helix-turn-helix transcriptional regulator n=1 Tax=unclassified Streptomyces TaxID=2593676 RepID=UPI0034276AFD